jgi:hypothetical protein
MPATGVVGVAAGGTEPGRSPVEYLQAVTSAEYRSRPRGGVGQPGLSVGRS